MSWNGTVTCGYCGASGHNKRGCPRLKADIERRRELYGDDDYRAALQTSGIGVGSLLVHTDWRDRQTRYLVTAINWEKVTAFDTRTGMPVYKVRDLANLTAGERVCPAPEGLMPTLGRHDTKVLAPKASIEVPADFLAGLTVKQAKAHLKEQEAWYWEGSSFAQRVALYTTEDTSTAT